MLAGGTDVYPAKAARVGWGDMRHPDVLDISAIDELARHRGDGDARPLRRADDLDATCAAPTLPPAFAGYQAAAREIGGAQVQNRGTLVGNICTASPAGDGIPCLLTLDAEVELASLGGRRVVPIGEFIDGYRHTVCRPDEIVTAILVPKPQPGARGQFPEARRAALSGHLHRHGRRRHLTADEDGAITAGARRGRRLLAGRAAAAGAGSGARRRSALPMRPTSSTPSISSPLAPIDDIRALRRLPPAPRRSIWCAICSPASPAERERRAA